MENFLVLTGRIFLGGLFVIAGLRHYPAARILISILATRKVPWPAAALHLSTALQIVLGALFALGIAIPWDALGLIAFVITATPIMANFWRMNGAERAAAINTWFTHLGIIGGLLIAMGLALAEPQL